MPTAVASGSAAYRVKALKILGELPPFSPVLNRLLADLGRDDISFNKVAALIEKDTVIAGNILRVVNSALYGRRGTVNSVRNAVSVLGINKLRNFVLGMSVARMWTSTALPKDFQPSRFNLHGVATAILADLLAQHVPVQYGEGAFVAGLFHDLGKMLIAIGMKNEHEEIQGLYAKRGRRLIDCEETVLGLNHADLSGTAINAWALPEPIQMAVLHHHRLHSGPPSQDRLPLSRLIAMADGHVNHNGKAVHPDTDQADLEAADPIESLGLGDRQTRILEQYEIELAMVAPFFS